MYLSRWVKIEGAPEAGSRQNNSMTNFVTGQKMKTASQRSWQVGINWKDVYLYFILWLCHILLTVVVIWFHPNPILCPCYVMRHFIWLWTVIARNKNQCHRLTLSQCRRRGPAWRSARGRGCWAGPGRWCPSSPGCPHTGGGRTHSATSWPASPWPSCTYHRCRLLSSSTDTSITMLIYFVCKL